MPYFAFTMDFQSTSLLYSKTNTPSNENRNVRKVMPITKKERFGLDLITGVSAKSCTNSAGLGIFFDNGFLRFGELTNKTDPCTNIQAILSHIQCF
jgi:hypothetical protein